MNKDVLTNNHIIVGISAGLQDLEATCPSFPGFYPSLPGPCSSPLVWGEQWGLDFNCMWYTMVYFYIIALNKTVLKSKQLDVLFLFELICFAHV